MHQRLKIIIERSSSPLTGENTLLHHGDSLRLYWFEQTSHSVDAFHLVGDACIAKGVGNLASGFLVSSIIPLASSVIKFEKASSIALDRVENLANEFRPLVSRGYAVLIQTKADRLS